MVLPDMVEQFVFSSQKLGKSAGGASPVDLLRTWMGDAGLAVVIVTSDDAHQVAAAH